MSFRAAAATDPPANCAEENQKRYSGAGHQDHWIDQRRETWRHVVDEAGELSIQTDHKT
jgi:hypothetical protein